MNIAILGTKGVPGRHGVEVVVDSLLPHLTALGHSLTVYGYSSYTDDLENYQGAKIKTVAGSARQNLEMISHMWHAANETYRHSYDIVHIHSADPCLLAWLPKSRNGIVATSHGQAYARKKWGFAAKAVSKLAEHFFIRIPEISTSVSKPLADYYLQKYGREILYIPNGIAFREKPDQNILHNWGLQAGEYLFCSAGRIERTKGLDTLMSAYRLLKLDIPLVIAGGGSGSDFAYFETLKKTAPEGVKFVGFQTGDDLFALYGYPKIFIFPSEYEAMSMALLEGLSFGTPTVYSDIPENEAVAAGIGYSFLVSDPDSLTQQINHVLSHYAEACERGKQARETIRINHDWSRIAGQYDAVYRKMAASANGKQMSPSSR